MVKTIGAKDRVSRRRTRSDRGHKRKLYRGLPVKTKRMIIFERKRGNKDSMKFWFFAILPMSEDGRLRFNNKIRRYMKPVIYKPLFVQEIPLEQMNSRKKIEEYVAENFWSGIFMIKTFGNSKNKYHCTSRRFCEVTVKETENGNIGRITHSGRLCRYKWFLKD